MQCIAVFNHRFVFWGLSSGVCLLGSEYVLWSTSSLVFFHFLRFDTFFLTNDISFLLYHCGYLKVLFLKGTKNEFFYVLADLVLNIGVIEMVNYFILFYFGLFYFGLFYLDGKDRLGPIIFFTYHN